MSYASELFEQHKRIKKGTISQNFSLFFFHFMQLKSLVNSKLIKDFVLCVKKLFINIMLELSV